MASGAVSHDHPGQGKRMERDLSSRWTFIVKFVVPGIWIPVVGMQVAAAYRRPPVIYTDARSMVPSLGANFYLIFWLLGSAMFLWFALPIKRVRLSDGAILVSNYFDEWRVPFGLIESVSQNRWGQNRAVTIQLRADVGFGATVKFLPPRRWFLFRFWKEDPVVPQLRELAGIGPRM
jgi:hypothetical protein